MSSWALKIGAKIIWCVVAWFTHSISRNAFLQRDLSGWGVRKIPHRHLTHTSLADFTPSMRCKWGISEVSWRYLTCRNAFLQGRFRQSSEYLAKKSQKRFFVVRSLLADVISHLTVVTSHFANVTSHLTVVSSHFADVSRLLLLQYDDDISVILSDASFLLCDLIQLT